MVVQVKTPRANRKLIDEQLAANPRMRKALEDLFNDVSTTLPDNVNEAIDTANNALTVAQAAQATANTALANAATALTTANTALGTANAALTAANAASAAAATALSTANSAQSTANTALTNANNAQTTANTAITNAAAAQTTANNALAIANAAAKIQLYTAVSASGTSVVFSSIPTWAKKISFTYNGLSSSGTSLYILQLGSSGIATSGYFSTLSVTNSLLGLDSTSTTVGFAIAFPAAASDLNYGTFELNLIGSNQWAGAGNCSATRTGLGGNHATYASGGGKSMPGVIDTIRLTTLNGTDNFDAGLVTITVEG